MSAGRSWAIGLLEQRLWAKERLNHRIGYCCYQILPCVILWSIFDNWKVGAAASMAALMVQNVIDFYVDMMRTERKYPPADGGSS